ncbi:hypothetical protein, partial [Flavobacterium sp. ALJ2]|uniref:hypothetical protein n=1 Tax=Flavobacterium sp. ALJ2 TaxID=2786960 RepID=UPI001E28FFA0
QKLKPTNLNYCAYRLELLLSITSYWSRNSNQRTQTIAPTGSNYSCWLRRTVVEANKPTNLNYYT